MPHPRENQTPPFAPAELARSQADATPHVPPRWCEHGDAPCKMCQEIGARVVRSEELLQGARELYIVHGNQVYRLLRTRNDKLILQK